MAALLLWGFGLGVLSPPAVQPAPALAREPGVRVAVVPAISTKRVLPTAPFQEFGSARELSLAAARGEYEPGSFVLRNDSPSPQTLRVVVDDLESTAGTIGSSSIDVKHVLVWYQASGAWVRWHRKPRNMDALLVPELLVNDPEIIQVDRENEHNYLRLSRPSGPEYILVSERKLSNGNVVPTVDEQPVYDSPTLSPVTIPPSENRQVWVTVQVPAGAAAGSYRGRIRILDAADEEVARLPLALEVHGFELPAPRLEYSMYYRGRLAEHHPTVSHEWKSRSQLKADLDSMLAHGISNPTCYQRLRPKHAVERASPISSREALVRYLEVRREVGLVDRPLYYLGRVTGKPSDPRHLAVLAEDTRDLVDLTRRYGVTELYLYGRDEAKGKDLIDQLPAWRAVKKEGGRVFASGRAGHFELTNGLTDLLVYQGPPLPEGRVVARKQRELGNRMFMYGYPQSGPEDPLVWRRNYGILLWQADYDGAMPFAFQSQFGSMWNDWDDENYRTATLTYPAADKPISTLAFEGLREGVDDVRYLTALENAIERLESEEVLPGDRRDALRAAERFLSRLEHAPDFEASAVRRETVAHLRVLAR